MLQLNGRCNKVVNSKPCRGIWRDTLTDGDWKECPSCYADEGVAKQCVRCAGRGWLRYVLNVRYDISMAAQIRDLEHRLNVAGRDYVLQVCGGGRHPAPVSAGPLDVMLVECVSEELLDHDDNSPDKIVRDVIDHAKRYMPSAITSEQWAEFYEVAFQWVCKHRAAAAIRDNED